MSTTESIDPVVRAAVTAVDSGDRAAFSALLAPGALLTDDGAPQEPLARLDREVFGAHARLTVREQQQHGHSLRPIARFHSDQWDFDAAFWHFTLAGGHIARLDAGQA